jgi:hypothetical protein
MLSLIRLFLGCLVVLFRPRAALVAENLALRHQLGILLRSRPARVPLTSWDRALWAFVLFRFPAWRQSLVIVKPETVIAWHRQAFRLFWRRKSQAGRPRAHAEVRRLIRRMASDNPTWGAPRIHGELLKLGFDVSERTVSRYLERIRPEPRRTGSQTWSTFLRNQAKGIVAVDLFTVPTVRFQAPGGSLLGHGDHRARRSLSLRQISLAHRNSLGVEAGSVPSLAPAAILAMHNTSRPPQGASFGRAFPDGASRSPARRRSSLASSTRQDYRFPATQTRSRPSCLAR